MNFSANMPIFAQNLKGMSDIFYTIDSPSEAIYREKMSRFLAFAIPVKSADEARAAIKDYQNKYHDARHVCWAYMIGPQRLEFQLNDNGEPSGTAGKPILGQINSFNLTDIVIIVVRYFGGIKLGIPGLIRAYRTSTADALANAEIIEKIASKMFRIHFGYMNMNGVMKVLKDMGLTPSAQDFGLQCALEVRVRLAWEEDFRKRMEELAKLEEK